MTISIRRRVVSPDLGVEDDREGRQHEGIDRAGHAGSGPRHDLDEEHQGREQQKETGGLATRTFDHERDGVALFHRRHAQHDEGEVGAGVDLGEGTPGQAVVIVADEPEHAARNGIERGDREDEQERG